ncbi:uncharacterized protein P884DRAFT_189260 [Thermothelomyces heterothallicus CBS 202.75]|uniref:uncharacterized protein n=1 Tax=Thermothelomyces heterothallicus CBS 202.75 TaxID=1149848 RepID=UPI0037435748
MSSSRDFVGLAEQASLQTSRSRQSIAASLRYKASYFLSRGGTINTTTSNDNDNNSTTAYNNPQTFQPHPLKSTRGWFRSVGARFHRHSHAALESSESSHDIQLELEENLHTTNLPSSSETTSSRSPPARRRPFRGRLRLHSLPARFRRRGDARFSRPSSLSDSDKENFLAMTVPPAHSRMLSNAGSWSSFRSGVQRAVRGKPGLAAHLSIKVLKQEPRSGGWQLSLLRGPFLKRSVFRRHLHTMHTQHLC